MKEFFIGTRLEHPKFGKGVIVDVDDEFYRIYFQDHGEKEISKRFENHVIIKLVEKPKEVGIPLEQIESVLKDILEPLTAPTEKVYLGDRWQGGELILQPKSRELQPKAMPIETFFHKIVMVRDRLRVMEQKINSSELSDTDKVDLQQYITRIYGSLTSFNVLFKFKEDQFKGTGSS